MSFAERQIRDETFEMGEVVSRTFASIGRNCSAFFALALLAVVPPLMLSVLLGVTNGAQQFPPGELFSKFPVMMLSAVVSLAFSAVLQAALTHGTVSDLNGEMASFGACLQTGLRMALPVIALSLMAGLAMVLGMMLLIIPGVLIALAWSVIIPVQVVEQNGIWDAFGRSAELTKGHRWAILGLAVAMFLITMLCGLAVVPLRSVLLIPGAGFAATLPVLAVSAVVQIFTHTLSAVGAASVYYELRSIKEGIGPEQLSSVFA